MIVCVQGLWHLGSVTAACLAAAGHRVIGLDFDAPTVAKLREGQAPISEPGLDALLRAHPIDFTIDAARAAEADILWVAYDTPVDADDNADVAFVMEQVAKTLPHLRAGAVVIVSSQLPVGSVAKLEALAPNVRFASSPENLRLGKAIEVFTKPDRVIVGVRDEQTRKVVTELLAPITDRIEWMTVESAEMTKHAINAFLALSVTFANELASVCERVGADAKEVERGLKTESRIGPKAYLAPGGAFAGGTLARDVAFLTALGKEHALALPLLSGVRPSNEAHKHWPQRRLIDRLGSLAGKSIAVWGLTYKAGTNTLRRSASVELCRDLAARGAKVVAWDPALVSEGDRSTAIAVPTELQGPWHVASGGATSGGATSGGATSTGATSAGATSSGGASHVDPSTIAPSTLAPSFLAPAPLVHAPHAATPSAGPHGSISLARDAAGAIDNADALVIATEWPQFRELDLATLMPRMKRRLVLDANRFLAAKLAGLDIEYYAVGVPTRG